MAKIIDRGLDSVHLTTSVEFIVLTIGGEEWRPGERLIPSSKFQINRQVRRHNFNVRRSKNRHTFLTPKHARCLAWSLLLEAARYEATMNAHSE